MFVCFALRAEWEKKMTALHFAIALGREEMVRLLIANGARPDMMVRIRAVHDWEPVSFSCFCRKEGDCRHPSSSLLFTTPFLCDHQVVSEDSSAVCPLMLLPPLFKHDPAAARAVASILVDAGVSSRQVDKSMSTALHGAIQVRSPDYVSSAHCHPSFTP